MNSFYGLYWCWVLERTLRNAEWQIMINYKGSQTFSPRFTVQFLHWSTVYFACSLFCCWDVKVFFILNVLTHVSSNCFWFLFALFSNTQHFFLLLCIQIFQLFVSSYRSVKCLIIFYQLYFWWIVSENYFGTMWSCNSKAETLLCQQRSV